jgi:hypothetical protein
MLTTKNPELSAPYSDLIDSLKIYKKLPIFPKKCHDISITIISLAWGRTSRSSRETFSLGLNGCIIPDGLKNLPIYPILIFNSR